MGCHQYPCACEKECTCARNEDGGIVVAQECLRHAKGLDKRPASPSPWWASGMRCPVCDPKQEFISDRDCKTCGGLGAFSKTRADYVTRCLETTRGTGPLWERVCKNTATAYIWPMNGELRWRPVCGQHLNVYKRAKNIVEIDRAWT